MSRKCFNEVLADMAKYNPNGVAVSYGDKKVKWKDLRYLFPKRLSDHHAVLDEKEQRKSCIKH